MVKSQIRNTPAILLMASFIAGPSFGQNTAADAAATRESEAIEQITVTASRIRTGGYESATPVTVVGLEKLESDAHPDFGDVLRELPAFGRSAGASNSERAGWVSDGSQGINYVSLRNLGPRRTLVMINGQRIVDSNLNYGGVNLSTIPSTLIERIEVVTGGASASWGSNAVAGVVNIIMNTDLDGFKANAQLQNNWDAEREVRKVEGSYGTGFLNDRGHLVVSASVHDSPDTYFNNLINGNRLTRLVENPAYTETNGEPRYIHADNVGLLRATPGGIITGGPLEGTYFVGPNATPLNFDYGNTSRGSFSWGGTPNYGLSQSDFGTTAIPQSRATGVGYVAYDITEDVTASVQLNYGQSEYLGNNWTAVFPGSLTIHDDNPFIPPSTLEAMQDLGVTSFPLGTSLTGDVGGNGGSISAERDSVGIPIVEGDRKLTRGVLSLDGTGTLFDNEWTWGAYFQHGEARAFTNMLNNPQNPAVFAAVDAVRVTPENVGTSGLTIGSIACRSTLTDPTNQCQPLDVFGTGKDVSAAAAYINMFARAGENYMRDQLKMDVFAASASGELPFGLAAGNVSSAFGAEYRKESGQIRASESGKDNIFKMGGNFKDFTGEFSTKEAFLEFNIPILSDKLVQLLSLDIAGRHTNYSFSGAVNTYKVGLLSQINDFLRLRGTYSRDIRAPSLFELFNEGALVGGVSVDPRTGQQVSTFSVSQGNINLTPEIASTATIGVIVTPEALLPNLTFSVDWWRIRVDDVINTANRSTTVNQCIAGEQLYCDNLIFDGPNGALSHILVQPVNSAFQLTEGWDFSADYSLSAFDGEMSFSFLGTYLDKDTLDTLGVVFNAAGGLGADQRRTSEPRVKGQVRATYSQDLWRLTAQGRILGRAKLNKEWGPLDVDDNDVPTVVYLDLRGSLDVNENIQLYAALDNALDEEPPIVTSTTTYVYTSPFRDQTYDVYGRVWRAGIRMSF